MFSISKIKNIGEGTNQAYGFHYRIHDNEATGSITSTKCTIKNCKATTISGTCKNCEVNNIGNANNHKGYNNKYILKTGSSGYISELKIYDSEFCYETTEKCTMSFNKLDTKTEFNNIKFNGSYTLANHNSFNSGTFKRCNFDNVQIQGRSSDNPNNSEILFENCTLNYSSCLVKGTNTGGEVKIRFKNCTIVDDGVEYRDNYGVHNSLIYLFSKPVGDSYITFENCNITKIGGNLLSSYYKQDTMYCKINFNNCTMNGDYGIYDNTAIVEKSNVRVYINGVEQN